MKLTNSQIKDIIYYEIKNWNWDLRPPTLQDFKPLLPELISSEFDHYSEHIVSTIEGIREYCLDAYKYQTTTYKGNGYGSGIEKVLPPNMNEKIWQDVVQLRKDYAAYYKNKTKPIEDDDIIQPEIKDAATQFVDKLIPNIPIDIKPSTDDIIESVVITNTKKDTEYESFIDDIKLIKANRDMYGSKGIDRSLTLEQSKQLTLLNKQKLTEKKSAMELYRQNQNKNNVVPNNVVPNNVVPNNVVPNNVVPNNVVPNNVVPNNVVPNNVVPNNVVPNIYNKIDIICGTWKEKMGDAYLSKSKIAQLFKIDKSNFNKKYGKYIDAKIKEFNIKVKLK